MKNIVVIISANSEWRVVRRVYPDAVIEPTPYGESFKISIGERPVIFVHGGWGKIAAAASAQYAVTRWQPELLVNLGTCGGFAGSVERGEVLLVERTLVYDIIEQMGDPTEAIRFYSTQLDLSWIKEPYPQPVRRGLLVSADRDICVPDIPHLISEYGAVAADWESGAIAWVAGRNQTRCLILRGVSDLVSAEGGEAYNDIEVFHNGTQKVIIPLLENLPAWLGCALS